MNSNRVTVLLSGNTAGTNAFVAQNIVFVGGNNVTLSGDPRGSIVMAAGSFNTSMATGVFAPLLHSHSQYLTTAQPPGSYLTTAAQSDHSHGGLSLSNLTGTSASNGLTLHAADPGGGAVISVGSFSRSTGTVEFGSTAGNVSFGMDSAGYITASAPGAGTGGGMGLNTAVTGSIGMTGNTSGLSISIPNFITTYASQTVQPAVGLNTALTGNGISWSVNSSGISMNVPAFITTYASQTVQPAIGLNSALTANGVSMSANSSGLSLNFPAFLTNAMATNEPHIQQIVYGTATKTIGSLVLSGSNGITVSADGNTALILFDGHHLNALIPSGNGYGTGFSSMTSGTVGLSAGQGVSFSQNGNLLGMQVATNYLVTAMASDAGSRFVGLNSALTANGVSASINSSGISLNFPAFLVTAAQSGHTHGAAVNLTGPVSGTSASNALSLDVLAVGLATAVTNLTATINSSGISLSAANPGAAAADPVLWCVPPWAAVNNALITNISAINNIPFFMPFYCDGALTGDEFHWQMSRATNGSNSFTVDIGFYSIVNTTSLSLASSVRAGYVATDTASISGIRLFEAPLGAAMSTLKQGAWVLGVVFSATATVRGNYSIMGNATVSGPNSNVIQAGTNSYAGQTAHQMMPFFGRYTTSSAALPNNVLHAAGASEIIGAASGASMPIPMCWTIGNHYA